MEELLIAVISAVADVIWGIFSPFASIWSPIDEAVANEGLVLVLMCLISGYAAGWLSTMVIKHALLAKSWMRITAFLTVPPLTGMQACHIREPSQRWDQWLVSRTFWLPFWAVMAFSAGRLTHVIH